MTNLMYLGGSGCSPYTRKLRATLRFRRINFRFVVIGGKEHQQLPPSPLPLLPSLTLTDSNENPTETLSDTTPIITRLDQEITTRQLRPKDPALAFIDALLEDYGDEWLSKCMFHYRWNNKADTEKASRYMAYTANVSMKQEDGENIATMLSERQISRIGVVGSNETTAPVIEASWPRFLDILDRHLQNHPFLLGHRPGAGDFGCYGQMTMLVITDPTPMAIAVETSPRSYAWTEYMEDLSGLEVSDDDWIDLQNPPRTLHDLLAEVGRVYVPFLLANAAAYDRGDKEFIGAIDGKPWAQETFVYQAKCLRNLRERYAALDATAKQTVDNVLIGTGCELLIEA